MKIKELKFLLEDLPDNWEICIEADLERFKKIKTIALITIKEKPNGEIYRKYGRGAIEKNAVFLD